MANFNKVILIGNLTKDPEIKYTPQGTAVTNITLAINREYKSGEEKKKEVSFVPVVIWAKIAEVVGQYCKKGNPLMVEGRITTRSWDDGEGKKHYKTEVVAEHIQLMGGRKEGEPAREATAPTTEDNWLEEDKSAES